jgi:hypothetical protein
MYKCSDTVGASSTAFFHTGTKESLCVHKFWRKRVGRQKEREALKEREKGKRISENNDRGNKKKKIKK